MVFSLARWEGGSENMALIQDTRGAYNLYYAGFAHHMGHGAQYEFY